MNKYLSLTLVASLFLGLAAIPALGQEASGDQVTIKGTVVLGPQGVDGRRVSSKFTEYRDVPNDFVFGIFDLSLAKGNRYLTFNADRIRQRDARYAISVGDYGRFRAEFVWDKIPHRFSFNAKTLYVQPEPGVFTIPDEIQSLAEAAVGDGGANAAANTGAGRTLISEFLPGVHPIDLGLQRNKGVLDLAYTPSVPWSFGLSASREKRTGNRESGASFGFSFANELPEPIDYITTELDARAEYSRPWGTLQGGVAVSLFDNEIESMRWDNPFRITDQTYETPFGAYVNGNGSVLGRMALAPSSNSERVYFKGLVKVAKYTRIYGTFSFSLFNQNAVLLPYTTNTALVADYAGALDSPRATAQAKAGVTSFDLSANSRLIESLYVKAGFRYYNFNDKTEPMDLPGYSRLDQVWEFEPIAVEPYSFMRSKAYADLTWHFMSNTALNLGYSYSRIERTEGEEVEGADENTSHENTFKVSLDSNVLDWLWLRGSYLHGIRRWSLDATDIIYIPGFAFKRYFESDRNRDSVNALVGLTPFRNFDIELSYQLGVDKYPTTSYGLKKSDFSGYGADLTYTLSKSASLFGFYEHELYKGDQADHQSDSGTFSTDPANDWTALIEDHVNTFGAGFNTALAKDKARLNMTYSFSRVRGTSLLTTPEGGSPATAANFTNGLDTTRISILRAYLQWKLRSNLSVRVSYWFEQWDLDDIVRNDYAVDFMTEASGIYLGALQPGYLYHVGSLMFIYSW